MSGRRAPQNRSPKRGEGNNAVLSNPEGVPTVLARPLKVKWS